MSCCPKKVHEKNPVKVICPNILFSPSGCKKVGPWPGSRVWHDGHADGGGRHGLRRSQRADAPAQRIGVHSGTHQSRVAGGGTYVQAQLLCVLALNRSKLLNPFARKIVAL